VWRCRPRFRKPTAPNAALSAALSSGSADFDTAALSRQVRGPHGGGEEGLRLELAHALEAYVQFYACHPDAAAHGKIFG
jgi:hypothetical protein